METAQKDREYLRAESPSTQKRLTVSAPSVGSVLLMAAAGSIAGGFVTAAGILVGLYLDRDSHRQVGLLIAAAILGGAGLIIFVGMGWVASRGPRSALALSIRSRVRRLWQMRWMPGGLIEASRTKRFGERARVTGTWSVPKLELVSGRGKVWHCPFCLGDNPYSDPDCYGCGARLDYQTNRVLAKAS